MAGVANAILIKRNQIGTLTEALAAILRFPLNEANRESLAIEAGILIPAARLIRTLNRPIEISEREADREFFTLQASSM